MANDFLECVFARYLLPETVYNMALGTYGRRYARLFCADFRLGARVTQLLSPDTSEAVLTVALEAGNRPALEFVLSGQRISRFLVVRVLSNWYLSESDRKRLSALKMPRDARLWLNDHPQPPLDTPSNDTWFRRMFDTEPRNQRFRDEKARTLMLCVGLTDMNPDWTLSTKPDWGPPAGHTAEIAQVLTNEMGDGSTSESLDAWRYFLALVDQGCDHPIVELVDAARSLSSSVLQTA